MSKNALDRYESCGELAKDLARWRMQLPVQARRLSMPERTLRFTKRNPTVSGLIGVLIVALTATLLLFLRNANLMHESGINRQQIGQQQKELAQLALEASQKQEEIENKNQELDEQKETLERKSRELSEIEQKTREAEQKFQSRIDNLNLVLRQKENQLEETERISAKIKNDADQLAEENRFEQYESAVRLASSRKRRGLLNGVIEALSACDQSLRNWEWQYLYRQANTVRWTSEGQHKILEACFSVDGKRVAVARDRSGIQILDAVTGQVIAELDGSSPRKSKHIPLEQRTMHFSGTGRYLIASTWQLKAPVAKLSAKLQYGLNRIWNLETGIFEDLRGMHGKFVGQRNHVLTLRLVWDKQTTRMGPKPYRLSYELVDLERSVGSGLDKEYVHLVDPKLGETVVGLEIPKLPKRFFSTNRQLAEISLDRKKNLLSVFNRVSDVIDSDEVTYRLKTENPATFGLPIRNSVDPNLCKVTNDETRFAFVDGTKVTVWEPATRKLLTSIQSQSVSSISLNQDGSELCVADDDGVKLHSIQTLDENAIDLGAGNLVEFHPTKRSVLVSNDSALRLHEIPGQPIPTQQQSILALAVSPTSSVALTAGTNGTVATWDLETRKQIYRINAAHAGGVTAATYFPSGDRFVTGGNDNRVRVWNAQTGKPISLELKIGSMTGGIRSLAINDSEKWIAIFDGFGRVSLCNLSSGDQIFSKAPEGRPKRDDALVGGIQWVASSDQEMLLSTTRLFSPEHRIERWTPRGESVTSVPKEIGALTLATSQTGDRESFGFDSGKLIVWNSAVQTTQAEVFSHDYSNPISSLTFNHDGSRLAVAVGGSIQLIDSLRGSELMTLQIPQVNLAKVRFSHDGELLIATEDGADRLHVFDGSKLN